jgi:hypothetical protein
LRHSIFEKDDGKLIVAIGFALETERPFFSVTGHVSSPLRCALLLARLENSLLRVENRCAGFVPQLYRDVIVEIEV